MSASELLREIEALPKEQQLWLWEKLSQKIDAEQVAWANFSTSQLAENYAPADSIYDEE
jgi:hypothetical protein